MLLPACLCLPLAILSNQLVSCPFCCRLLAFDSAVRCCPSLPPHTRFSFGNRNTSTMAPKRRRVVRSAKIQSRKPRCGRRWRETVSLLCRRWLLMQHPTTDHPTAISALVRKVERRHARSRGDLNQIARRSRLTQGKALIADGPRARKLSLIQIWQSS